MMIFALGWILGLLVGCGVQHSARRHGLLPPATARSLRRARRANRLELRERQPQRWVSPASVNFDDEETR